MTIQENMTTQKKITAQKKIIDPGRTKLILLTVQKVMKIPKAARNPEIMTIQENMTTQKKITAQKKIIDPGRTKQNVFNQQEDPCRTYCFSCK